MSASYAIVSEGVVVNIVSWDGVGDIFSSFIAVEIEDGVICDVGWTYSDGKFSDPNYSEPESSVLYQNDLVSLASEYGEDVKELSDQYAKAALIDGVNEDTKKAAIYAEYQARKVTYKSDLAALKVKYGV